MKFFKNPIVALILAIIIVFTSSFLSIYSGLRDDIDALMDCFYYGAEHHRSDSSIHSSLLNLCNLSEAVIIFADGHGIEYSELVSAKTELEKELNSVELDIDDIYDEYASLVAELDMFRVALGDVSLSVSEARQAAELLNESENLKNNINNSAYNALRTEFAGGLGWLERLFIEMFDLYIPDYFI